MLRGVDRVGQPVDSPEVSERLPKFLTTLLRTSRHDENQAQLAYMHGVQERKVSMKS